MMAEPLAEPLAEPHSEPTPPNRVVVLRRRGDDHLDWLCERIRRDRFLPVPPPDLQFVGDGDFRAIGAEFLRHFVRLGGLRPNHRVLEVGCGVGRMAIPLTQYLDSSYDGVDVVKAGVDWCASAVTPAYPSVRFHHLDVVNGLYNPDGATPARAATLPFAGGAFDFVIMTSVVTHLRRAETERYAAEAARVLRPGGRAFLSLFLVDDDARAGLRDGRTRPAFAAEPDGPEHVADPDAPNAAVAYDESWLLALFAGHGLRPARPILHGHWARANGAENFQDLLVLEKGEHAP